MWHLKLKTIIGSFLLILTIFLSINPRFTFASESTIKKSLPKGYDFEYLIKNSYKSITDYTKLFNSDALENPNPYGLALAMLTLGLVKDESTAILGAKYFFSLSLNKPENHREKEMSLLGIKYTDNLLFNKGFNGEKKNVAILQAINIEKPILQRKDFKKIIIGKSAIKISKGSKIKTQVDRVTRDWLSAYNITSPPWHLRYEKIVPWHEGEKIREILKYVDVKVAPVWGTIAKKIDNHWYAPDAEGFFRFRISEDKIYYYPSTIIIDEDTVVMNDTHGINAIAWDSLDASLVIGCGDFDGKIQAAYYLALKGVNVYMPTDRFVYLLMGTKTKGTIIGSAPIRKTPDGAIIGGQSILIDINEPIMVTNTDGSYPLQYYDTPYRYFKELEKYLGRPLKIMPVDITEYGKADKLIWRAKRAGVKVIGIRVASKEEYEAVSWFLKTDKSHRVVLFHSAVYPYGYRLFFEFPNQTTFGDINIDFE